ncbi:hypothetical protein CERZMDRAFT_27236, partial [Cercospora zeae-maydis SCOH1-5]
RPRITIQIIAPNHQLDQELLTLDLPSDLSIADLKGFVTAETQIPQASQQFFLNNQALRDDSKSLDAAGVQDGDLIAMLMSRPQQNNMGAQRQHQQAARGRGPPRSPEEIESTRQNILGNPGAMVQIREQRPALAAAIHDSNRFREVWQEMDREDQERERQRQEQMRLLNEDPF